MSNNLRAGEFYGKVPNKRIASAATLTEVVHSQKIDIPKHSHELGHFQLLFAGSCYENCGGREMLLQPSTISWYRPGMTHRDEIGTSGGRFFMIELPSRSIDRILEFAPLPDDFFDRNSPLVWLGHRLHREFRNWQFCSDLIAEGLILEMLSHAVRRQNAVEKQPPAWLSRVVEKLNEEFAGTFSSEQLALEANVHPVYLAAMFRRFYNQTMGEYVQRLRVGYASRLLENKEIPLSEIAFSSGFSDQSHFNRIFKRVAGMTPMSFRNLF